MQGEEEVAVRTVVPTDVSSAHDSLLSRPHLLFVRRTIQTTVSGIYIL